HRSLRLPPPSPTRRSSDLGIVELEPLGVLIGHLHGERGEKAVRIGHGERQRRVLDRVQPQERAVGLAGEQGVSRAAQADQAVRKDRKSTRLNSSHGSISYA